MWNFGHAHVRQQRHRQTCMDIFVFQVHSLVIRRVKRNILEIKLLKEWKYRHQDFSSFTDRDCCGHSVKLRTHFGLRYAGLLIFLLWKCGGDVSQSRNCADTTHIFFCSYRWHQWFDLAPSDHPSQTHPAIATSCPVTSLRALMPHSCPYDRVIRLSAM